MDLRGKTMLITGANTGIGQATAEALGRRGAALFLAGRSEARHDRILTSLRGMGVQATFLPLDLSDLASVRSCAAQFLAFDTPLDVLINNAGIAGARGQTKDGFELTFGVDHLGPFLFTELLLPRLLESPPARIVNVASMAHYRATGIDWEALQKPTASLTALPEYQVAKLCNILHAKELSARLAGTGVTTYALHPGVIASDVWRSVPWGVRQTIRLFMKSTEEGASTSIHCATSEEAGKQTGLYYHDCAPKEPSALAQDATLASELDKRCRAWVGL